MRIASNYSDYYYSRSNQLNSLSNTSLSAVSSDSSQNETEEISFPARKRSAAVRDGNIMNLSLSGSMLKYSLQTQESESTEMHERMEKIRADMDSIKTADIDSMTADEVKETLTNLQADMALMPPRPDGSTNDIQQADIDSMTESEMREMLQEIQDQAKNAPEPPEGMPPMMGGAMPSMTENDTQSLIQQIMEKVSEVYGSSTESSDNAMDKLKEVLEAMFDDWGNQEKTETQVI